MTLTKDHIVNIINRELNIPKKRSIEIVESLLEIIKSKLSEGEDVLISGFGKFCVKEKKERRGRNPATGEDLMLGSRKVVTFKCSGVLKDKIKGQ
ncbi:integration host factor subunit alpha [Thermodesulfobacteriota bacterium]